MARRAAPFDDHQQERDRVDDAACIGRRPPAASTPPRAQLRALVALRAPRLEQHRHEDDREDHQREHDGRLPGPARDRLLDPSSRSAAATADNGAAGRGLGMLLEHAAVGPESARP